MQTLCRQGLRTAAIACAVLTATTFSAPSHTVAFAQGTDVGAGEFQAWCSRCHGLDGKGDGPIAKELETRPPDLTQLSANNGGTFPAERVQSSIDGRTMDAGHGSRQMPVWGNWFSFDVTAGGLLKTDEAKTQEEISERIGRITAYLKSIQR